MTSFDLRGIAGSPSLRKTSDAQRMFPGQCIANVNNGFSDGHQRQLRSHGRPSLSGAAWPADARVAGTGGVGILSDDSDFRAFHAEIEYAFGLRVY